MITIPSFAETALGSPAAQAFAAARGATPEQAPWSTPEGVEGSVSSILRADLASLDFLHTWPGLAPFLRGPYPTMYTTQPWTIRQYAGFSTAEDQQCVLPP